MKLSLLWRGTVSAFTTILWVQSVVAVVRVQDAPSGLSVSESAQALDTVPSLQRAFLAQRDRANVLERKVEELQTHLLAERTRDAMLTAKLDRVRADIEDYDKLDESSETTIHNVAVAAIPIAAMPTPHPAGTVATSSQNVTVPKSLATAIVPTPLLCAAEPCASSSPDKSLNSSVNKSKGSSDVIKQNSKEDDSDATKDIASLNNTRKNPVNGSLDSFAHLEQQLKEEDARIDGFEGEYETEDIAVRPGEDDDGAIVTKVVSKESSAMERSPTADADVDLQALESEADFPGDENGPQKGQNRGSDALQAELVISPSPETDDTFFSDAALAARGIDTDAINLSLDVFA